MGQYITLTMLFPVVLLAALLTFFFAYWRGRRNVLEVAQAPQRQPFTFPKLHPMTKKDALPLLILTAAYAITAFFSLGSFSAPQSRLEIGNGGVAEVTFSRPILASSIQYFSGLGTGNYNVEVTSDGETWHTLWQRKDDPSDATKVTGYYWTSQEGYGNSYAMPQKYTDLFKWVTLKLDNPQYIQRLRITGRTDREGGLALAELALYETDIDGNSYRVDIRPNGSEIEEGADTVLAVGSDALFDEGDTVPDVATWYHSSYFDEIYHARTALEHIDNVYPFEVSHPPLGKLILSIGISLFGMTPFGWRFMGTLFGVLMLPILYVFLKNLFGKRTVATAGTALFAFDFMHLTQTRIATIDTYAVFFILCMYFFLYRFLALEPGTPFWKCAIPLGLSGLSWGIGVACKWTVIYGGAGLCVLYVVGMVLKLRRWPQDEEGKAAGYGSWCVKILLYSVLVFVLLPFGIYVASYIPYATALGVPLSLDGLWEDMGALCYNLWGNWTVGEGFQPVSIAKDNLSGIVMENQWFMLHYHEGVHTPHPYSSRWYQWIVDARPILYYLGYEDVAGAGMRMSFGAFHNPVVAWGGLLALGTVAVKLVTKRCAQCLFILVGYLSQLLPWVFIGRITFAYHYFPSVLFLVLAFGWVFNDWLEMRGKPGQTAVYAVAGGAIGLYAVFYPVLIGLAVPTWYSNLVKWLPSWPF